MFSFNPFAGKKENFFPFAFASSSSNSATLICILLKLVLIRKSYLNLIQCSSSSKNLTYYTIFTSNSFLLDNDLLSSVVLNGDYYLNCALFFDGPKRAGSKELVYVIPELLYSISSHIMGHIFALAIISNLPARISKA